MTKVVKIWMKFSFWTKLKSIFATLGVGGEFALFIGDSHQSYKWVVGGCTVLAVLITYLIEDSNKDGVADIFQKDKDLK
jgi:hypothetical protein